MEFHFFFYIFIFIYFFKYETIVRSSARPFGHSDPDPSSVQCKNYLFQVSKLFENLDWKPKEGLSLEYGNNMYFLDFNTCNQILEKLTVGLSIRILPSTLGLSEVTSRSPIVVCFVNFVFPEISIL